MDHLVKFSADIIYESRQRVTITREVRLGILPPRQCSIDLSLFIGRTRVVAVGFNLDSGSYRVALEEVKIPTRLIVNHKGKDLGILLEGLLPGWQGTEAFKGIIVE